MRLLTTVTAVLFTAFVAAPSAALGDGLGSEFVLIAPGLAWLLRRRALRGVASLVFLIASLGVAFALALPVGASTLIDADNDPLLPVGHPGGVLDTATGLLWLDADELQGRSLGDVDAERVPGGQLEGWRFAEPCDLYTFTRDADFWIANGRVTDPDIAAKMAALTSIFGSTEGPNALNLLFPALYTNDPSAWRISAGEGSGWVGLNGLGDVWDWTTRDPEFGVALVRGPRLLSCSFPACDDAYDNDHDGRFDYPNDPGCESPEDDSEKSPLLVCDNGLDDDGDNFRSEGYLDYGEYEQGRTGDPGCESPTDPSEKSPDLACDDGVDNDADGLVDYGPDLGCAWPGDASEQDGPATFIVNSAADSPDATEGDGVCEDASGACTLRAAIDEANALLGWDEIVVPEGTFPGGFEAYRLTIRGAGAARTRLAGGLAGVDLLLAQLSAESFSGSGSLELSSVVIRPASQTEIAVTHTGGELRIRDSLIRGGSVGLNVNHEQLESGACLPENVSIVNTTISGNGIGISAGCFCSCGGAGIAMENSTISDNEVGLGGFSLFGLWFGFQGHVQLRNTIIAGNDVIPALLGANADCCIDDNSTMVSRGHNLDSDGTCRLGDPSDISGVDPLLGPLQNNGGQTSSHALLSGSPAIGAIPAADCTYDDDGDPGTPEVPLTTDQRGVLRPQGDACDIGAYEVTACADGVNNDSDAFADLEDPGCRDAASVTESPQCQDGTNNDAGQDGLVDFDGGQSIHGQCQGGICPPGVSDPDGDGIANPDPQCAGNPWNNTEPQATGCGLGSELVLIFPALMWLRRRSRETT